MKEYLENGSCLDVNAVGVPVEGFEGVAWELKKFLDGYDYCDAKNERWMWSIGQRVTDSRIFAATDTRFYANPMFKCLWLR
jgi:hypothetical protein